MHPSIPSLKPLVTSNHGRISGIYYDALRLQFGPITTLGFTCNPSERSEIDDSLPPQFIRPLPPVSGFPAGIFRSQALLGDISTIKTCYVNNRCTGMAIQYADCTAEILGQWFESRGRHDVIYDIRCDTMFDKLRFWLSGAGTTVVVKSVCTVRASHNVPHSNTTTVLKDIGRGVGLTYRLYMLLLIAM